tara:strand:- start:300 stop:527 length:228 start_codon:yes stop_codon:yes gene_type:complete
MNTIHQFAAITKNMSGVSSSLGDLAFNYKEIAPRTDLDVAHIDLLVAQANEMIAVAESLKSVEYDPSDSPEETEA